MATEAAAEVEGAVIEAAGDSANPSHINLAYRGLFL
jgi:hypothetical protein